MIQQNLILIYQASSYPWKTIFTIEKFQWYSAGEKNCEKVDRQNSRIHVDITLAE